jgi:hypothetical protein
MKTEIPCDCGSVENVCWRGDRYGLRVYLCAECNRELEVKRVVGPGKPTHFRPKQANVSACGIENPDLSAFDGRSVDCIKCRRTKAWRIYMGKE